MLLKGLYYVHVPVVTVDTAHSYTNCTCHCNKLITYLCVNHMQHDDTFLSFLNYPFNISEQYI